MKLTLGQTVFLFDHRYTGEPKLKPVTVTKIGTKYFECSHGPRRRYRIITGYEDCGAYSSRSRIYESEESYANEVEAHQILDRLFKIFNYGEGRGFSLAKLRKIEAAVKESE